MFCKNCGAPMNQNAAFCVNCGAAVGQGYTHCANCGNEVAPGAAVCLKCGAMLNNPVVTPGAPAGAPGTAAPKSKITAGLLGIFLGGLGIHNFYLGYTNKAIAQVLMGGLGWLLPLISCFILWPLLFVAIASSVWGLVEGIMILAGAIKTDGKGFPLQS